MDPLQAAFGAHIFDTPPRRRHRRAARAASGAAPASSSNRSWREAGLPADLADALDDTSWDDEIRAETDEALALTGKDVGTPIIQFEPPDGVAFFGPVISRLPEPGRRPASCGTTWSGLARFPGFAELKRSLREQPQLAAFGVEPGHRRQAGGLARWQPPTEEVSVR